MTRNILVPVDGSDSSWDALEFALRHHSDATITVYYVIDTLAQAESHPAGGPPTFADEVLEPGEEYAETLVNEAEDRATEHDVSIETEYEWGLPRDAILEYVEEHPCDQIIIGSHGRTGVKRLLVGSVAEHITRHAPVPVTVVRSEAAATAD